MRSLGFVEALSLSFLACPRVSATTTFAQNAQHTANIASTCSVKPFSLRFLQSSETCPLFPISIETPWPSSFHVTPTATSKSVEEISATSPDPSTASKGDHSIKATILTEALTATNVFPTTVFQQNDSNTPNPSILVPGDPEGPSAYTPDGPLVAGSKLQGEDHAVAVPSATAPPEGLLDETLNELDQALDAAHFLSFEEWKESMLKESGQLPENVKGSMNRQDEHRHAPGLDNALESLGEDGEIELDFSGFVARQPSVVLSSPGSKTINKEAQPSSTAALTIPKERSKKSGTTSKERFNYASFDCAATILKINPEAKGATAILSENKDSYLLNKCSAKNKFLIVELCNDILIDTIVLANYEFFSSTFRSVRFSVADHYPAKADKWRELGTFEARSTRAMQAFPIHDGKVWTRYLRIEFLTHYGKEYYCPVSLLRVHGQNMIDDYKHAMASASGEDIDEDITEELSSDLEETSSSVVASVPSLSPQDSKIFAPAAASSSHTGTQASPSSATALVTPRPKTIVDSCQRTYGNPLVADYCLASAMCRSSSVSCPMEEYYAGKEQQDLLHTEEHRVAARDGSIVDKASNVSTGDSVKASTSVSIAPKNTHVTNVHPEHVKEVSAQRPSIPAIPAPASPQDSFFKSVHKRLQMLETNSTLSLRYIEDQSKILRDAFVKVEKRQLAKLNTFLDIMNTTVVRELLDLKNQYDSLWTMMLSDVSAERKQMYTEVSAMSTRLSLLADEMTFQKRIVFLQFILIVLCLGLIIFSRNSQGGYLELNILKDLMGKQSGHRGAFSADSGTAVQTPLSRPVSKGSLFWNSPLTTKTRSRSISNSSHRRLDGPSASTDPGSPVSQDDGFTPSEGQTPVVEHDSAIFGNLDDGLSLRRAVSSPPEDRIRMKDNDDEDETRSNIQLPTPEPEVEFVSGESNTPQGSSVAHDTHM